MKAIKKIIFWILLILSIFIFMTILGVSSDPSQKTISRIMIAYILFFWVLYFFLKRRKKKKILEITNKEKIKKIIFWILFILSALLIIAFLGMIGEAKQKIIPIFMIVYILFFWSPYIIIKLNKKHGFSVTSKRDKKKQIIEEKKNEFFKKNKNYILAAEYEGTLLFVNKKEKKFVINDYKYRFEDLISAEIITDDDVITVTNTKKKASVGKALVGGTLFGGGGAIVGGNAGKSRSISQNRKVCDKLQIKLTINSISTPIIYIYFIDKRIAKNGYFSNYKKICERAEYFLGIFQVIINNKK